ncbi:regulator of (H+)-ATPase in vacuolar membrane [Sarracenia purpurea var. burkii]
MGRLFIRLNKNHRSTAADNQLFIDWKVRDGSAVDVTAGFPFLAAIPSQPVQMVRLFGVNIFKVPVNGGAADSNGSCGGGKRTIEMELLSLDCSKKPRAIGAL